MCIDRSCLDNRARWVSVNSYLVMEIVRTTGREAHKLIGIRDHSARSIAIETNY